MPNTQDKILANSKMASAHSAYMPVIMGTLIASIIFFTSSPYGLFDAICGFLYLILTFVATMKLTKAEKKIIEDYNGS